MAEDKAKKQSKKTKQVKRPKSDKTADYQARIDELTADLQRIRADFENYRKRNEQEKEQARIRGQAAAVIKLLPVIDDIERAVSYAPKDISDHAWVKGVVGLVKKLDTALTKLDLTRIPAGKGQEFNPDLHEAIQFDEDAEGDREVVESELQAGYLLGGTVIRPAMVKVTKENSKK